MLLFSLTTVFGEVATRLERREALQTANTDDLLLAVYDRVGMTMAREMLIASSFALGNRCTDPDNRLGLPKSYQDHETPDVGDYESVTSAEALRDNGETALLGELNARLPTLEARLAKVQHIGGVLGLECGDEAARRRKCYAAESTVFVERTPGSGVVSDTVPVEMWEVTTGSRVLSRDAETGELYFDEVGLNAPNFRYRAPEFRTCSGMRRLTFGDEHNEFHLTASHGLYTKSGEVKPAGDLVPGDEIHTAQGWERVVSNDAIPGDRLISNLYTTRGQYLVGAPGEFNATRAAVGTNMAVQSLSKLTHSPFMHDAARHLRSLNPRGSDWHLHEYCVDMIAWYLPKTQGSLLTPVVAVLLSAPLLALYLASLPLASSPVCCCAAAVAGAFAFLARRSTRSPVEKKRD